MECLRAQELISDALDRVPVDPTELIDAKDHCRGCADCSAFVRALVAVQRAPLPEPPADLADRVMEAVRAESALAAAAAPAPASGEVPGVSAGRADSVIARDDLSERLPDAAPISLERLSTRLRDPRHRRVLVTWVSAAAAVFILAGYVAITGVRSILVPQTAEVTMSSPTASGPTAESGPAPQDKAADMSGATGQSAAAAYIVLNGTAYVGRGEDSSVDAATLTDAGTVTTALDSGTAPVSHTVLVGPDPARAYIRLDDGRVLAFERVTRAYRGRNYALQSADIASFGIWPTLPPDIAEPTAEDGSPTFTAEESDPSGVVIYRKAGGSVDEGFALEPNSDAGNPNWTWWTPIQ